MLNSRLLNIETDSALEISEYEELETNENGKVELKHEPVSQLFVYSKSTGLPI
jgi:hypothetical protein